MPQNSWHNLLHYIMFSVTSWYVSVNFTPIVLQDNLPGAIISESPLATGISLMSVSVTGFQTLTDDSAAVRSKEPSLDKVKARTPDLWPMRSIECNLSEEASVAFHTYNFHALVFITWQSVLLAQPLFRLHSQLSIMYACLPVTYEMYLKSHICLLYSQHDCRLTWHKDICCSC